MSAVDPSSSPVTAAQQGLLEEFARAYLLQQRREQRWRWWWRVLWILVAVSMVWAAMHNMPASSAPSSPHTALVEVPTA